MKDTTRKIETENAEITYTIEFGIESDDYPSGYNYKSDSITYESGSAYLDGVKVIFAEIQYYDEDGNPTTSKEYNSEKEIPKDVLKLIEDDFTGNEEEIIESFSEY